MENFTNETITTQQLPQFEEVQFTSLHSSYSKIIFFNLGLILLGLIVAPIVIEIVKPTLLSGRNLLLMGITSFVILGLLLSYYIISFKKRGFAFREHDVLYKSGVLTQTTTIIPYNRIQHVALHEGFISRKLNLAAIEIFTAGGNASDIEIPGIQKEQAENIKQLVMNKIQKQL